MSREGKFVVGKELQQEPVKARMVVRWDPCWVIQDLEVRKVRKVFELIERDDKSELESF